MIKWLQTKSPLERGGVAGCFVSDVLGRPAARHRLGQPLRWGGDLPQSLPDSWAGGLEVEIDRVGRDEPDGGEGHAPAQQAQPARRGLGVQGTLEELQAVKEYEVYQAEYEDDLASKCQ